MIRLDNQRSGAVSYRQGRINIETDIDGSCNASSINERKDSEGYASRATDRSRRPFEIAIKNLFLLDRVAQIYRCRVLHALRNFA
jgi:hypothetical protein